MGLFKFFLGYGINLVLRKWGFAKNTHTLCYFIVFGGWLVVGLAFAGGGALVVVALEVLPWAGLWGWGTA
ncbi:hypothetical protein ACQWFX_24895, partial [Salmonella enterica subsp. enterica serovar Infantis]